jgi:hypothetical protein
MKVETILLQRVSSSQSHSTGRPYVAVGVIALNTLTQQRSFFEPEGGGEIVLSSGALSSPQLLSCSRILPEDFPLHSLREEIDNSSFGQPSSPSSASFPTAQFDRFTLPDIGKSLLDHPILPYICFANWWNSHPQQQRTWLPFSHAGSSTESSSEPSPYPPNSVHGWIFLNESGDLYDPLNEISPPKSVVLCPPI